MKYILGVDGGGTKTEAIAYDLNGEIISKGISGFGNPVVNIEKALGNIKDAIDKCIKELGRSDCVHIYLGIAGTHVGDGKEKVKQYIIENFHCKTTVVDDAELAFSALLKGRDGFLTIAGTGSICIGKYKNNKVRVGGWGHVLGDEGSGYYISIEALKKIILEKDMGDKRSEFTQEILNKIGINDEYNIMDFVYNSDKGKIAAIMPAIVKLSQNNNIQAIDILREAGEKLGLMTLIAIDRMDISEKINVAITGSVITNIKLVRESFIKTLEKKIKDFAIYNDCISSTKGAYYEVIKQIKS